VVLLPAGLWAQAAPAVRGGVPALSVGGYYSNFHSDYTPNRLGGLGTYFDWNLFSHLGVEGEARWLRFNQQLGSHEDNYLGGLRYYRRYHKFVPYAKFLVGVAEFEFPSNQGHGGYFAMAPGGGLDYRLTRHFTIRAVDYEYQFWPEAPGGGLPTHGLTPNGFSFGASYRVF
jgi:hypothetical protein